ncbi:unnamed protein product [Plutella xylostella]|uniref:(diamondback moth) hypothetical protein n=1 Tax=Plutella xylostella TaxID=51655 RepID=A0A8S4G368_PLUXY|nr:unnamed protein product [Plutella xylostella]
MCRITANAKMHSLKILLPDFNKNEKVYFYGHIFEETTARYVVYITKFSIIESDLMPYHKSKNNVIYGHYSPCDTEENITSNNYVIINRSMQIQAIKLNKVSVAPPSNCVIMKYDYDKFKRSKIHLSASNMDDYFSKLQKLIQRDHNSILGNRDCEETFTINSWIASSMFIQHLLSYIHLLTWLRRSISRDKTVQLKQANLILAITVDFLLGYVVLTLLVQDKKELSVMLMDLLEKLVNSLYSLLKWLMGAPAGLKLNYAFNNMLGKYFSYHIQLWWLFLDVSGEKLHIVLQIYQYVGYLGLTFQAAMVCDMICIATFHAYCIYVYAARLFNIQMSGLIALFRLFVGRKRNPLRARIDSCEYCSEQLFVGTVAFSALLLLLPTTTMYYTVFTIFRAMSLAVQSALARFIHLVQTMPLYVTVLWLIRSPKVAGNIFVEMAPEGGPSPLVLNVRVLPKSLGSLIHDFKPPAVRAKPVEWNNLVSNLLTGKQIT